MRFYYDTEFIENGKTVDLISIGIVREDGEEYYAVNSDMPEQRILNDAWLRETVWPHLPLELHGNTVVGPTNDPESGPWKLRPLDLKDSRVKPKWVIGNEVRDFICSARPREAEIELWAHYAAYDHVVLAQLFGTMLDLPKRVPMWTNDLRQEQHRLGISSHEIPERDQILSGYTVGAEHNALADARWNRAFHSWLRRVKSGLAERRPQ